MGLSEPQVSARVEQRHAAIGAVATMASISEVLPQLFGEVVAWTAKVGPAGPPFVKYDVIDMQGEL